MGFQLSFTEKAIEIVRDKAVCVGVSETVREMYGALDNLVPHVNSKQVVPMDHPRETSAGL